MEDKEQKTDLHSEMKMTVPSLFLLVLDLNVLDIWCSSEINGYIRNCAVL